MTINLTRYYIDICLVVKYICIVDARFIVTKTGFVNEQDRSISDFERKKELNDVISRIQNLK